MALTIFQDEDARKLQLALAKRPSVLRNVCNRVGGLEMNIEPKPTMTAQNRIMQDLRKGRWIKERPCCSCSPLIRKRAATYSISNVEIFKTSLDFSNHCVTCPFYIGIDSTTSIGFKMTYYGRLLANTVRATISITAGAGGISISPCLNFRALVPNNSPAFRLLDHNEFGRLVHSTPPSQTNKLCEFFDKTLQQLYKLFKDRAASPTDTNQYGETLLFVI